MATPSGSPSEVVVCYIADIKYHRNDTSVDFNRRPDYVTLQVPLYISYGGVRTRNRKDAAHWPAEHAALEFFKKRPKEYRIEPVHRAATSHP
jgi:hypothetical protein